MAGRAIGIVGGGPSQSGQFFTPVEEFAHVLKDIPTTGKSRPMPWLGIIDITGLATMEAAIYGIGDKPAIRINSVIPGEAGAKVGLKDGDVIIGLNGQPLDKLPTPDSTARNLLRAVSRMKIGQEIKLTILRDKQPAPVEVPMTLSAAPAPPIESPRWYEPTVGISTRELTFLERASRRMKPEDQGVLIDYVRQDGPAVQKLGPGDWLMKVDTSPVTGLDNLKSTLTASLKGKPEVIIMTVQRGNDVKEVRIDLKPKG